ncbi:uncharacterized protein MONBRDRAFT_36341 [Monosiga brevicollis MX1]|uniref:Uncharacterized protein n=1 Tax=Monosiga brevicollis TaxID=81824 RepID=A9UV17_MONBE|nr:uncharacterized protein MONBRDRAFT_36341 [Monosiga brevicollis MX1]EDQ90813.1 predicted protein [Monosiga brevicollis MX1]|eukprot:XP_001744110.1 hypothetical protein [Monosiga brevicollis MX1]
MPPTFATTSSDAKKTIVVSGAKRELFNLSHGLKQFQRKLKSNWKLVALKDQLVPEKLEDAHTVIFMGPRDKFSAAEFDVLRQYLDGGGSVLMLLGEGGETKLNTNVNFLLEEYGIMVNNDAVLRSSYYKYHHPKECLVTNGILNRELNRAAGKFVPNVTGAPNAAAADSCIKYLYPFGATLTVQQPAVPVLSSGTVSIPLNRPTGAFYESNASLPSWARATFSVTSILTRHEENPLLLDVLLQWLTTDDISLNHIDAEDPEVAEYNQIPHIAKLAEQPRGCLQDSDDVPRDFTQLFELETFQIDASAVPAAVRAYADMSVPHEPLKLIHPQFETPQPPLRPAVFAPTFRELGPPALDLFDLDEAFSSEVVRMNQLTNKCTDDDLEYFVRECGDILGVSHRLESDKRDGKHILEYVMRQLVNFKKSTQS